jgi:hypothetical protein
VTPKLQALGRRRCIATLWLAVAVVLLLPSPALAQTFGTTAALNPNAGSDSGTDSNPHLVSDGDGNWLAVWSDNGSLAGPGLDFDILYSMSSDDDGFADGFEDEHGTQITDTDADGSCDGGGTGGGACTAGPDSCPFVPNGYIYGSISSP